MSLLIFSSDVLDDDAMLGGKFPRFSSILKTQDELIKIKVELKSLKDMEAEESTKFDFIYLLIDFSFNLFCFCCVLKTRMIIITL